jgi:acyl-CoA synthetase (AMP-forming)/AMP-acid ligase II
VSAPLARLVGPALPDSPVATGVGALARAAASAARLVFVDASEREQGLSWREVQGRALRVAAGLRVLGVLPGDRVALLLPTSPGFMDAFFGCWLAGAVPVPLYPPVRLGRLEEYHRTTARMLTVCGARLVLTDARVRLLLGASVEAARPPLGLRTVEDVAGEGGALGSLAPVPASPEALALVQFSSGSTVDPKPVALTHGQLVAQLAALRARMPPPPTEGGRTPAGVSWLPLYHDMGLIGCLLSGAYYPGDMVLLPPEVFLARPALWLRAISRHRAFVSAAPNFAYGLVLKRVRDAELAGVDLSCWRYALNGAEPVSPEVMERFLARLAPHGLAPSALLPVYGMSEAALAVTFPPEGRASPRALALDARHLAAVGEVVDAGAGAAGRRAVPSVGVPVAGFALEVRDELGHVLPERRVGRVWARGPSVMEGYLGQPEASARALKGGWLDTGDLGFVADGELFVCGRAKDVVIIRGANHPPQAFEDCLAGLPGVRAGCAVAVGFRPEGEEDEALLLLVETEGAPEPAALAEAVRARVVEGTGVRPHTVRLLEPGTLPRTSSGKLRRAEALRRHVAGELAPPGSAGPVTLAVEMARSALALARAGRGRG